MCCTPCIWYTFVQVKLSEYEVQDSLGGCREVSRLPVLVPLLKASLQLARQGVGTLVTSLVLPLHTTPSSLPCPSPPPSFYPPFHALIDSERQVEHTWILALGLKALHRLLQVRHKQTESHCPNCQGFPPQTSDTKEVVEKLLSVGLVPSIVKLASKPTHFSQKWKLTDLEVPQTCPGWWVCHYCLLLSTGVGCSELPASSPQWVL